MFRIEWSEPANGDIDELADYLAAQEGNFAVAEVIIQRILKASEHLASLPWAGKPGRLPETREWQVKKTSYSLIYSVVESTVYILRVMHSSRLFPESASGAEVNGVKQ